ncbi:unnamed protein product [Spirodela intermedia]|uniref:Uncharacterized protein n=1 Tax=Spirodela intermedia TaxID=51605 RepID=A0A7I8I7M9_SPIIN|nr:unnamed protein product [Spirodela intermedia]CAA6653605.1 unnamed protein product [Spirodela intermedia]
MSLRWVPAGRRLSTVVDLAHLSSPPPLPSTSTASSPPPRRSSSSPTASLLRPSLAQPPPPAAAPLPRQILPPTRTPPLPPPPSLPPIFFLFLLPVRGGGVHRGDPELRPGRKPSAALRTFLSIRSDFGVNASVRSFNALLNAMIQNRRYDLVGVLFRNCSRKFGIAPNVFTCNILVKALCKMGNLDGALKVLEEMPLWGMIPNLVTFTTLEDLLRDGGQRDLPDATAFTVLMEGYCAENRIMEAVRIMDEMAENGVTAGEVTYSLIISALCNSGKPVEALNLLHDMLDGGHLPGAPLCCKLFDDLCHQGKVEDAYGAWKKLLKKNFAPDGTIASTLIHWLCKKGKLWEAEELLQLVEGGAPASLLPYNTIIAGMCELGSCRKPGGCGPHGREGLLPKCLQLWRPHRGFCRAGKAREAVAVLREMVERGLVPDGATCSAIVDGLDDAADRDEVTQVLGQGRQSTAATSAASS